MGRKWSRSPSYHNLVSSYVDQTTTHGVRRISASRHIGRRIFWICIFMTSFGACCYHSSHLISLYVSNPKVTITEEMDAAFVEFPAITVCNLNIIKKNFGERYFKMVSSSDNSEAGSNPDQRTTCTFSEYELLFESAVDLSDTWLNLGFTKDNLTRYGHQSKDLIVQCTYNSKECNSSRAFYTKIQSVASPLFGLCHIISVLNRENSKPILVKRAGTVNGIRLTLNIEREMYWDLISAAYGIRVLIHPQGTYPTLQRGGIIVSPGRSVHIGVKRRVSGLLPGWEGTCTESFAKSNLMGFLSDLGLGFDIAETKYTYEYCNTLCQNALLFNVCNCLDEQPTGSSKTAWKFCNPCNKEEADCRSSFLKNFTDNVTQCDTVCKPACHSIRYEISLSKSDWPNLNHQQYVVNRSRDQWLNIPEALGLLTMPFEEDIEKDNSTYLNDTFFSPSYNGQFISYTCNLHFSSLRFFSENLLRVHLFVEEMIYMSIQERYSYTLPKLLADLGGCLGLYLGVSVISIIEVVELCGGASILCLCRVRNNNKKHVPRSSLTRTGSVKKSKRNRTRSTTVNPYSTNYGTSTRFTRRRNQVDGANQMDVWRPPFAGFDVYNSDTASIAYDRRY